MTIWHRRRRRGTKARWMQERRVCRRIDLQMRLCHRVKAPWPPLTPSPKKHFFFSTYSNKWRPRFRSECVYELRSTRLLKKSKRSPADRLVIKGRIKPNPVDCSEINQSRREPIISKWYDLVSRNEIREMELREWGDLTDSSPSNRLFYFHLLLFLHTPHFIKELPIFGIAFGAIKYKKENILIL